MTFSIENYTWPAFQGRKPYSHQLTTVARAIQHKRFMILNDMGTGKTLSALWACDILMTAGRIRRVLIIGPLSTMASVWFNEISFNLPHRTKMIAHGNPEIRKRAMESQCDFVIMNHDGIKSCEKMIIDQQFDIIIIDELTAFKANSDRTKCMQRIADAQDAYKPGKRDSNRARKRDGGVWGMTGELTPNSPEEAFYPCHIVVNNNQYLPKFKGQFRDACMFYMPKADKWFAKPEAPQIVAMCAHPSIRFTREQCLDLPATTFITVNTPLTPEQEEAYKKMNDQNMLEYSLGQVTAVNAAVKLNKLLQISAGAVKDLEGNVHEIGCKPRIDELVNIYENTRNRKLVIFATFRATIEMLLRELRARGIKTEAIHGDIPQGKRGTLINDFQTGDLNILVLQPQSTAHGITLVAASTMVWFSLVPSNELFQQGIARIVRAGQNEKTFIYLMVSTRAERHIANILERKGDVSRAVMEVFVENIT